jgi:hypothetical protein
MVFKLVDPAQKSWHRFDGPSRSKVVNGASLNDGLEVAHVIDRQSQATA